MEKTFLFSFLSIQLSTKFLIIFFFFQKRGFKHLEYFIHKSIRINLLSKALLKLCIKIFCLPHTFKESLLFQSTLIRIRFNIRRNCLNQFNIEQVVFRQFFGPIWHQPWRPILSRCHLAVGLLPRWVH